MTDKPNRQRSDEDQRRTRPKVVREDQVTPATEIADLPHEEDVVGEASEESFPASDPPAYSGRRKSDEADHSKRNPNV